MKFAPRRSVLLAAVLLAVLVFADVTVERTRERLNGEFATQLRLADLDGTIHDLRGLVTSAPGDPRTAAELARRTRELRAMLPALDRLRRSGDVPPRLPGEARRVLRALPTLSQLPPPRRVDAFGGLDAMTERADSRLDARVAKLSRRSDLVTHGTFYGTAVGVLLLIALLERSTRHAARAGTDRRYRTIAEFGADVSFELAGDGRVLAVTGPVEQLLGRSARSLVGSPLAELADPADALLLRRFVDDAGARHTLQWRARRSDGSSVALESTATDLLGDPDVRALVLTTRDVSARQALEEQLRHRAFHDELTGLPNRALFQDRLERALARRDNRVAVLLVDLDDFKAVNDRLGHAGGDKALAVVARLLHDSVRSSDTPARLAGDEFAVLLDSVQCASEAVEIAQRILASLRAADVAGASVGLTVGASEDDRRELLRQADLALQAAKAAGKGHLELYDDRLEGRPARPATTNPRAEEERAEVRALLEREDALSIVFQPIVDLRDAVLTGYEALARFPGGQGRSPDVWFKQAHRYGLGARVEAQALRAALASPGRPAGSYVALNVSPSALVSADVQAVLPADLSGIVIEITEHELVLGGERLLEALADVRRRGGRVAVDDAGAGYTGLRQLTVLAPDIVKLDRALVDGVAGDPAKASLIEAFVRFCRRMGANVCAEGIERLDDLRALADLDVAYGQGYRLARPLPPWTEPGPEALQTLRDAHAASLTPARADGAVGDQALEVLAARLSAAQTTDHVAATFPLVARCLHADGLAYSELDAARDEVVTLDPDGWTSFGEVYALADYPATRHVLDTHAVLQVRAGDPCSDPAEVALLAAEEGGAYRSVLLIPVLAAGAAIGLLEAYSCEDRPWTREQVSHARLISYQLGAALMRLPQAAERA